jgi:hypothetical protein
MINIHTQYTREMARRQKREAIANYIGGFICLAIMFAAIWLASFL